MITSQIILQRLSNAVNGSEKELYTDGELREFAEFYLDKWDDNTSEDVIAEAFVDYWWNSSHPCRRCSECGSLMCEGYCVSMGAAYYCCDQCLYKHFTPSEWQQECENDDQSYYTEWR